MDTEDDLAKGDIMTDSALFNDFTKVLKEQSDLVKQLIKLERDFTVTASKDDTDNLETLVRDSQPDLLNFRGLEHRRNKLAEQLGWKGLKSSQILSKLDDEERHILEPIFSDLKESLTTLQESQEAADRIMRIRLNDVNTVIANRPVPKAFQDTLA